ncbi:Zdhhc9 [Symbiodinium sp. CCMP2592]|nr:Zdhhc9 [Symbiodinium sp. CCMP2592]
MGRRARAGLKASAEDLARDALQSNSISEHLVQEVVSLMQIPPGKRFKTTSAKGMVLGLYVWGDKVDISTATRKFPFCTKLFARYAQQERPAFPFTSVQLNINLRSPPHVDGGNLGSSLITGVGDYAGGEVFVENAGGNSKFRVPHDVRGSHYKKDMVVQGFDVQVKGRWFEFDGNKLHATRPFTGDRCTLVFFTCSKYELASPSVRMALGKAGFSFLWSNPLLKQINTLPMTQQATDNVAKTIAHTLETTWDLFNVDSSNVGGAKEFEKKFSVLKRKAKALPEDFAVQLKVFLKQTHKHFEPQSPGGWRRFLLPVLVLLGEDQRKVGPYQKNLAKTFAMMPVRKAQKEAEMLAASCVSGATRSRKSLQDWTGREVDEKKKPGAKRSMMTNSTSTKGKKSGLSKGTTAAEKLAKRTGKRRGRPPTKLTKKQLQKLTPITRKQCLRRQPEGCSRCRSVPGCCPSCWQRRGYHVTD